MHTPRCFECGAELAGGPSAEGAFDVNVTPGTWHHKLLNTNESPEDPDVPIVQSFSLTVGARLANLDQEISRLRDRLRQLEEEHTSLSRVRANNNAILSPLRRIPAELLAEIFWWTLPSVRAASNRGRFDIADSPWVLTHVGSRWRAVAITTPSLWSLVAIDYQPHNPSYIPRASAYPVPMLETQIQRAQKLKIHFYTASNEHSEHRMEMFKLLVQQSTRWEEASLGATQAMLPLLATLRDQVPLLRRLWIQWDDQLYSSSMQSIDCFHTAPSLVDVSIYERYHSVSIPMPLHQLTRYDLDGPLDMHLNCLRLGKNLVEARIYVVIDQAPSQEPLELSSLCRLYVSDPAFLDYLRVPALKELALWVRNEDVPDILTPLESLLARSSCLLQRLFLRGAQNVHTTTEILRRIPSIVELGITITTSGYSDEVNALMSIFTVPDARIDPPVALHLRRMFFGCDNDTSIDYAGYLQMISSRWKAADCSLEGAALLIDSGVGPDPATLGGLDELRQDGLDFSFLLGTEALEVLGAHIYTSTWN